MQATPRVFATLDLGAATAATALIGRVDRRWRLLGALSGPATTVPERLLEILADRVQAADPDLAESVGLVPAAAADLPILVARSAPPRTLAVLTASERAMAALAGVVARSGWRWIGMSADRHDASAMTGLLLDPGVTAVLVAVGDPPGGDERGAVGLLGAVAAAAATRRPDLTIVLAGAVARSRGRFGAGGSAASGPGLDEDTTAAEPGLDEDRMAAPAMGEAAELSEDGVAAGPDEFAGDMDAATGGASSGRSTAESERTAEAGADPLGVAPLDAATASSPRADDRRPAAIDGDAWRRADGSDGRLVIGPTAPAAAPAWSGLTELLAGLRRDENDSRQAIARSIAGLAGALDRRLELVEVGHDGGLRAIAAPGGVAGLGSGMSMAVADAALVPPDLDDARLERILGWSTLALDRHRLKDRLIELRTAPWVGLGGDGGRLRLAAARAALATLIELTPDLDGVPPPDLVVLGGGAFGPVPGAAALLAVADVLRRPGAYQVGFDHASLLGPLGTIEDPAERDRLLVDLAGDLLVPLGSVVMPAGLHAGRRPGQVTVAGQGQRTVIPLLPGSVERLDVPAGARASVLLEAGDGVRLGGAGRRMTVEVAGGVGGLLIDLRDVPLRLPDRRETRREVLLRWQEAAWPGGTA